MLVFSYITHHGGFLCCHFKHCASNTPAGQANTCKWGSLCVYCTSSIICCQRMLLIFIAGLCTCTGTSTKTQSASEYQPLHDLLCRSLRKTRAPKHGLPDIWFCPHAPPLWPLLVPSSMVCPSWTSAVCSDPVSCWDHGCSYWDRGAWHSRSQ